MIPQMICTMVTPLLLAHSLVVADGRQDGKAHDGHAD